MFVFAAVSLYLLAWVAILSRRSYLGLPLYLLSILFAVGGFLDGNYAPVEKVIRLAIAIAMYGALIYADEYGLDNASRPTLRQVLEGWRSIINEHRLAFACRNDIIFPRPDGTSGYDDRWM